MTPRDVVRTALGGTQHPPYVPWQVGLTQKAAAKLRDHYGTADLDGPLGNHCVWLGNDFGFFEDLGNDRFRDHFGVVWNRSVDRDIGVVEGQVLPEPALTGWRPPDPRDRRFFEDIPGKLAARPDAFRVFSLGFSLYERAWTLRGLERLMMDFHDHPAFVRDLLETIADYNVEQIREALTHDIDAVRFGDDWGQQRGLQMGPRAWRAFILPVLRRMYGVVRAAGKFVMIHCCGDVDELFEDLIDAGVSCFNPFQPEVMDVWSLLPRYRGRLAFHGGLSTQQTLPFGTPEAVRDETRRLLALGREGGYLFAPAHDVAGDVPTENMLAFVEVLQAQPAWRSIGK
jgi:uroporphyrinogen decarboxylase